MNPTFADIVTLLNTLYNNDPNIGNAPHAAFWQNTTRNAFVQIQTDAWGVNGPLVALGQPQGSNLYLALSGQPPLRWLGTAPDARYRARGGCSWPARDPSGASDGIDLDHK